MLKDKTRRIMNTIELILKEREAQVTKGFDTKHDLKHDEGLLAIAAGCYAMPEHLRDVRAFGPFYWPFETDEWKPSPDDRKRELVKAAALLVAEIDRLSVQEAIERNWDTPQQAVDFCRGTEDPDYVAACIAQFNLAKGELGFATELLMLFRNQWGVQVAQEIDEVIDKAPLGLPPYPPVPEGFTHWVERGYEWEPQRTVVCAWINPSDDAPEWRTPAHAHCPAGYDTLFYLEAIVAKKARIPVGMDVYQDHRTFDWPKEWANVVFDIHRELRSVSRLALKAPGFGAKDDYGSGAVWIESSQVKDLIPVED